MRTDSPADSERSQSSFRDRSVSKKRKSSDSAGPTYAEMTTNRPDPFSAPGASSSSTLATQVYIDEMFNDLSKANSLCDALSTSIRSVPEGTDNSIVAALTSILEALNITNTLQGKLIASLAIPAATRPSTSAPLVNMSTFSKRNRNENTAQQRDRSQVNTRQSAPPPPPVDPTVKKFKDAVKEAEKSTLVFNLNMGKVPIMNQNSISSKATAALTEMAASAEGKAGRIPSNESVAAIDDVLSVVSGMSFYGKATKTYRNPRDKTNSGAFCTVPVKYSFKDKDTRIRAEIVLRNTCKVNCSTPYPVILRETLRQVVNHVKKDFPENMVRVNVDLPKLALRVARKPPGSNQIWKDYKELIPLPAECYDVAARKIPENFTVTSLPFTAPMETDSGSASGKSPPAKSPLRLSRKDQFTNSPKAVTQTVAADARSAPPP